MPPFNADRRNRLADVAIEETDIEDVLRSMFAEGRDEEKGKG